MRSRPGTAPDGTTQERAVPRRVVVGNLGYDVSFTLPKSYSGAISYYEPAATRVAAVMTGWCST